MSEHDLVIQNSSILLPSGLVKANLAIDGEKISVISTSTLASNRKIDAEGKVLLPGIVDLHCHMREPGYTYKEDFETGSMAAAAGGITTFVDMPNVKPTTNSLARFESKRKTAGAKSVVDYNHFVFPNLREVKKLARAGAAGFKIFMERGAYPFNPNVCVEDHAKIYEIFSAVKETGLPCVVHPADMSLFELFYEKEKREHLKEPNFISYARTLVEDVVYTAPVSLILRFARETGVRLHIVHVFSPNAITEIREAKRDGFDVTAEIDPKYFIFSSRDLKRMGPLVVPGGLLGEEKVKVIWEALRSGWIDVLSSDHAPHTRSEIIRTAKKNPMVAPFGGSQLEHYLMVFLNEVKNGSISLEQLSRLTSSNPARLVGLYPKKGVIAVGSDADLIVVDMKKEVTISAKGMYSKVGWTPYEGRRVKGAPIITIRRGEIIAEEGTVLAKPGSGKFARPIHKKSN